jgi:hypothetical protein
LKSHGSGFSALCVSSVKRPQSVRQLTTVNHRGTITRVSGVKPLMDLAARVTPAVLVCRADSGVSGHGKLGVA